MSLPDFARSINGMSKKAWRIRKNVLDEIKKYRLSNHPSNEFPKKETTHILSPKLEEMFGLKGSEIRAIVSWYATQRVEVLSDTKGYYFGDKAAELEHPIKSISSRIEKLTQRRNGMKKRQHEMYEKELKVKMNIEITAEQNIATQLGLPL